MGETLIKREKRKVEKKGGRWKPEPKVLEFEKII
jgi:hypothetical protein